MGIKLGRGNTVHADAIEAQPEDSVTRCGRSADMVAGVSDAVTCKSCVKLTEADALKAASAAQALDAKAQALIEETNELIDAIEQRHPDTRALPTVEVPGYVWRWHEPQGGQSTNYGCAQLMYADNRSLSPAATVIRNVDGTWRAEQGPQWGMAAILAGQFSRSLTMAQCAEILAQLAAERAQGIIHDHAPGYGCGSRCRAPEVPAEPVHYGYDKIVSGLPTGEGLATVALRDGDTAVAPGTTKRVFQGPAVITYRAYCDGGMDVVDAGTATLVSVPRREVRAPVELSSMLIGSAGYGRTTDDRIDGPRRFRAAHGKRKTHTVRRFRRG